MFKEQVLFYISSRGSARYCVTSKLILSVDLFLQNSKRLKYEVAFYERGRSRTQGAAGVAGPSLPQLVPGGVGPAPLLPQHRHLHILGISAASPGVGQLSWEMLQRGRFNKAQLGTNFCPYPPQLGPADHLARCAKPAPKHPLPPL